MHNFFFNVFLRSFSIQLDKNSHVLLGIKINLEVNFQEKMAKMGCLMGHLCHTNHLSKNDIYLHDISAIFGVNLAMGLDLQEMISLFG